MPFNQIQEAAVIKALGEKIQKGCPACGLLMRQLIPDLYLFQLYTPIQKLRYRNLAGMTSVTMPAPGTVTSGVSSLPSVVIVCGNCGFTEFYNVHRLGIASILNVPEPGGPIG